MHEPVLRGAVMAALRPMAGWRILDMTVGGGGHAASLLRAISPGGSLIGVDKDERALAVAAGVLAFGGDAVRLVHADFKRLPAAGVPAFAAGFHGILADLGCSSMQLDDSDRGFSFRLDGPLDMRMDTSTGVTAARYLETISEGELGQVIRDYGEERWWRRIARAIVRERAGEPITTTGRLARVVERVAPRRGSDRIHPATRTFQAIRIAVNGELDGLEEALAAAIGWLLPGGRLAVIAFHSLEDRIVKRLFARESKDCLCPPEVIECRCGHVSTGRAVTRRPVRPENDEVRRNPRARSARLRVFEKAGAV
ncbi:16S rRNA (cytosine(1402)-N(4))-methyltransferase RsmH [bacterium]|nr:16S rRNA (cytosine(1402)-N(4))-methyltransferase RsmH [candidate division CSSED10-310 bacterium]